MKNLLTAALAALLCSCGGANYAITGRYELPPGDSVYLLASDNTVLAAGVVNADTTVSLQGTVTTPDLVFLANAKRTNHPAWLFLEPGKIRIEKYDPAFGYVVCGTPLNDRKKAFDEAMYAFGDKLRKGSPGQSLQAILAEMNALYTQIVDANLDNVFGAWVFNSYEFQNIKDNPEKVKARLAQFTPGIQAHPMLKKSQDASQATARSAVGQPYTDFSCKNTAGETIALSSLTGPGRWVLLDFWATWCTPCMNEVPHLKKAYETFHAKGFEIYGVSLDTDLTRWENTIGPLESRKPLRNLWGYHQTMGLGYYEYFQFCEDIGAEPLPVVAAGVCCQNSSIGGAGQMGIPMEKMPEYIESLLNLIEWANGDPSESPWAKMRAEAGHPKPFNLKYLGVGNEDLITPVFEERFTMIFKAIKEKYPEIQVVGTSGPFSEGPDYVEGWKVASKLGVPLVDEHYYQPAGWFLNNHDYYDRYDRSKPKVYLGEYATHIPGKGNNIETALLEAYHLIGCERNGDIVSMTSYAPLLAKDRRTRWRPDLIYFNNMEVKPGTSYYTQLLFGQNSGNEYIPSVLTLSDNRDDVRKRIGISVVKDSLSQDLILKIVNLLPVKVQANIDLAVLGITGKQDATKTVLSGMPDDWKARPETSSIAIAPQFRDELPAYSLTVVRLKSKP